ncbi:MAG TPA: di-trans,poly-cis-decaprenylcistransferase [Thermoprotei archaeon]|nr:di-trans,poly-cis-decaprenylcistransferase [Thermoprotei archaeon]
MKQYILTRKLLLLFGIYKIYEYLLFSEIRKGPIPKHVGVILDGNRRWARAKGVKKEIAYSEGAKKVENIVNWCDELGVKSLTIFVLSTENYLKRDRSEIEIIFNLLKKYLTKLVRESERNKKQMNIKFIGNLSLLEDEELLHLIQDIERIYNFDGGITINIAFLYGGKWDIINAAKKIAKEVKEGRLNPEDINIESFQRYLSTSHMDHQDIDLILRTGGESRLSNFLLWQAAYSELVFLDVFWPDFRKIDFLRAVRIYQKRTRRFGA